MNTVTKTLNLLLVAGMFFAIYIMGSTHEAAELWPTDDPDRTARVMAEREQLPVNVPAWRASDADRGCSEIVPGETFNMPVGSDMLVVTQANERVILSFDEAWERTHNDNRADDVWVIGFCS